MKVCEHLKMIHDRIRKTAVACGRDPETIKLIAVSKRQDIEKIRAMHACGQKTFGENYIQEAQEKIKHGQLDEARWHFIGHLQSNKTATAVELFDLIQTVDRAKVAKKIQLHAARLGKRQKILVQVNVGREKQKSGVLPEDAAALLESIVQEPNIEILGLMTMPPWSKDPEASRTYFRQLRELARDLADKKLFNHQEQVELSMGMSGDYQIAIEEGATMVRIGTALFGARP